MRVCGVNSGGAEREALLKQVNICALGWWVFSSAGGAFSGITQIVSVGLFLKQVTGVIITL
jgi:hypothetical protein